MRIVFMGTPEFAVPALRKLLESGLGVVAVVTQPDRPVGRSGQAQPPAVKQAALVAGLTVLQPSSVRDSSFVSQLRSLAPDVVVVAAFGQILTNALLAIPSHGFVNIHASLLPKYRGAAPIAAAIQAGELETGVSVIVVTPKLDTGPILAQRHVAILPDDTTETLSRRLAVAGADLLVETLPGYVSGDLLPLAQDESRATYVPMLRKEQGRIDWQRSAVEIERLCRAYSPWPGCYTYWNERLIKLLAVRALPGMPESDIPGTVLVRGNGSEMIVLTGGGALAIHRLQIEGKRPVTAEEFLRGHREIAGKVLR